jgi:hypothetical protein
MAVDDAKLNEFLHRFVGDLGATVHAANVVIGDKLGLYKALAAAGPSTPAELAERSDTHPRYVAEWLAGQAAGGHVAYDPAERPTAASPAARSRSCGWPPWATPTGRSPASCSSAPAPSRCALAASRSSSTAAPAPTPPAGPASSAC